MKQFKQLLGNKKILSLCLALVLIAAIGVVNYKLTNADSRAETEQTSTEAEETTDVFLQYRNERTSQRAEEISYIDSVIAGESADEQTKSEAEARKIELVNSMETELTTEGLIRTKMMMDAVVTVKNGAVNVVVDRSTLSDETVAQIAEIVKAQTGEAAQNIKIMPSGAQEES